MNTFFKKHLIKYNEKLPTLFKARLIVYNLLYT